MPTYTLELQDGRRIKVEADNEADALEAADNFVATGQRELPAQERLSDNSTARIGPQTDRNRDLTPAQIAAFERVPGGYQTRGEVGSAGRPIALSQGDDGSRLAVGQYGITVDGQYVQGRNPRRMFGPAQRGQTRNAMTEVVEGLNQINRAVPMASEVAALGQVGTNAMQDALAGQPVLGFQDYWQDARQQQADMQADFEGRRPLVANFLTGVPAAAAMFVPGLNAMAPVAATRSANIAAGAGMGAASGAIMGYAQPGDLQERADNAYAGIAAGGMLGGLVGRFTPTPAAQQRRMPQQARDMMMAGVDLTPGQMAGGQLRQAEEQMRSLPAMGFAIGEAERRGIEQFNRITTNRALAPIGDRVPESVPTGRPAVDYAQRAIGEQFNQIQRQASLRADDQLTGELQQALADINPTLPPDRQRQLQSIIDNTVIGRIQMAGEAVDGRTLQDMGTRLREQASSYLGSADPDQRSMGQALESIRRAVDNAMIRQNPSLARPVTQARAAYSRLPRLERAAASAGARDGIATPNQFAAAGRAEDRSLRRRATAAGRIPDQAFFDAAQGTLSSRVPDSGTAGRSALMAGLAGTGAAVAAPATAPFVMGAGAAVGAGALAYSPAAIRALNKLARDRVTALDARLAREALERQGFTGQQIDAAVASIRNRVAVGAGATAAPENRAVARTAGQ